MSSSNGHYYLWLHKSSKKFISRDKKNEIVFLFNATKLRFNDETPIKIIFENNSCPRVIVNDVTALIGG